VPRNRPSAKLAGPPRPRALLTVDVEEYFHVEAAARSGVRPERWESCPSRLDGQIDLLLSLLDRADAKATFFILGWVAGRQPDVVRRIARAGHDVATHGQSHTMLDRLGPSAFRDELRRSRSLLEDLTGQKVLGFRAPTFSIRHATAWALDVLAEEGFDYDSSVFPVRHDRYGVPEAPRWTHRAVGSAGGELLEIPPLTLRAFGANWPIGGGGYLRLLPPRMLLAACRAAHRARQPAMLYLHPWEVDPDQPDVVTGRLRRWRHRVNLGKTANKLTFLLDRLDCCPVADALDAGLAPTCTFRYGPCTPPGPG
jgi:polysaccharide deacetylase family protein (PEP-CTERM system associated)